MMKKSLFCLVAMLFMSPAFASIYKWKDANGRTHYGDTSPTADIVKVGAGKQANIQIAKGEIVPSEPEGLTRQGAMNETRDSANSPDPKVRSVK